MAQFGLTLAKTGQVYRAPVRINSMSQVMVNKEGMLERTYRFGHNATVTNDHNLMYYWAKNLQIDGKLASTGVSCIHVDEHDDMRTISAVPPVLKNIIGKSGKLNAVWKYTQEQVEIGQPFAPLVQDRTLDDIYHIANYGLKEKDLSARVYSCSTHGDAFMGKQSMEMRWVHDMREFSPTGDTRIINFHLGGFQDMLAWFDVNISGLSRSEARKKLFISLDIDFFTGKKYNDPLFWDRDYESPGGKFVNFAALKRYRDFHAELMKRTGPLFTFVCTSSPTFTHPDSAKIILKKLEPVL